ncbi:MAG: hypothetical protein CNB76_02045 [Puniceicoccaceae bacterium MED-G32]|nr:MAG: hypothetical protein CNB76_02045 [Puniceicoccaceae bacterium MED-G32]
MITKKNKLMNLILLNFFLITVFLLTSCSSSNSIRLKGSSDSKKDDFSNVEIVKEIEGASIVHIDQKQRIVTIRSNKVLNKGYYITISSLSEKESSVLKLYDASYESLFIADILEGSPKINDSIAQATKERSKELDQNYTEADID